MNTFQKLFIYFFIFLFSSNFCFSDDNVTKKIYISLEQIVLENDGIFLITENDFIPVSQISNDNDGYYFLKKIRQCKYGHDINCRKCDGCLNRTCMCSCKCR